MLIKNLEVIRFLYCGTQCSITSKEKGLKIFKNNFNSAAKHGQLKITKYLNNIVTLQSKTQKLEAIINAIGWAVLNGHLELIKYLYSSAASKDKELINNKYDIIDIDVQCNRLEIVKYFRNK
jgi:CII-binding regulator of phage lambda lysogenization HflD